METTSSMYLTEGEIQWSELKPKKRGRKFKNYNENHNEFTGKCLITDI